MTSASVFSSTAASISAASAPVDRVHAHVERFVAPETEPAIRRIELQRRHAEIGQHPVDLSDAPFVQHVFECAVIGVDDFDRRAGAAQRLPRVLERLFDHDRAR